MRAIGRLAAASTGANTTKQSLLFSSSSFCSNSGGGRGRGRGVSSPYTSPVPGKLGTADENSDASEEFAADDFTPPGRGRGRGKPLPPPVTNVFSPWRSPSSAAVGRGRSPPPPDEAFKAPIFLRRQDADADSESAPSIAGAGHGQPVKPPETDSLSPIFFPREDAASEPTPKSEFEQTPHKSVLPQSILKGVRGAGRGQTLKPPEPDTHAREENRHLRRGGQQPGVPTARRMNREEAVENAVRILGGRRVGGLEGGGRGRGGRGRGRGGRGMQAGRGRGGRGVGIGADVIPGVDQDILGLLLGENVDEDALRQRLGEEKISKLKEVVNEINYRVFPYPLKDLYLDALDTNFLVSLFSMLDK